MHGLFFTGTDTGVGKTVIAAAVVRLLRRQGRSCRVSKPVATGANWVNGRWLSSDTVLLAEAAGMSEWEQVTPWTFSEPAAPPVAARQAGVRLSLAELAAEVRKLDQPGGVVVVEGVGGLLCPLTEQHTIADLAAELGLALVIVARRSLGTLNHTLLTLEAAQRHGLCVAGIVVNETSLPSSLAEMTNLDELRRRIVEPVLGVVPYQGEGCPDACAALEAVDWWALAQGSGGT